MPDLLSVQQVKSNIRLSRKARLKVWWARRRLAWKYGDHILDMVDDCAAEVEREFLFGKEHDVEGY